MRPAGRLRARGGLVPYQRGDPFQLSVSSRKRAHQQYFFWSLDPSGAYGKVGKIFTPRWTVWGALRAWWQAALFRGEITESRRLLRPKHPAPRGSPPMLVRPSQSHSRSEPCCQGWPCAVGLQELGSRESRYVLLGLKTRTGGKGKKNAWCLGLQSGALSGLRLGTITLVLL